jgi:hypothetical protein
MGWTHDNGKSETTWTRNHGESYGERRTQLWRLTLASRRIRRRLAPSFRNWFISRGAYHLRPQDQEFNRARGLNRIATGSGEKNLQFSQLFYRKEGSIRYSRQQARQQTPSWRCRTACRTVELEQAQQGVRTSQKSSHKKLESSAFADLAKRNLDLEVVLGYVIVVPCCPLVENVWRGCLSASATESSLDLRLIG